MEGKKKTNIIALTDFSEYGLSAVRHAATLARLFQSSLTILPNFSFRRNFIKKHPPKEFDMLLEEFAPSLEIKVDEEHYFPNQLHHFADQTNTIMYVIAVGRRKKDTFFNCRNAMRFIKPSRLPVMTVGKEPPRDEKWLNVLLTIDPDRQSKEKSLWAGYFCRFGGATIHLLHTVYKEAVLNDKLEDGKEFIDKLYQNLEITSEAHEITPHTDDLEAYALRHTSDYDASLLVVMTTKYHTWVDALFGPREQQWIANPAHFPVLCINERDDLYVLCT